MAKNPYADVKKFKGLERALRDATNGWRAVIDQIDAALAGPRTDDERAALQSLRTQAARLQEDGRTLHGRFYSELADVL